MTADIQPIVGGVATLDQFDGYVEILTPRRKKCRLAVTFVEERKVIGDSNYDGIRGSEGGRIHDHLLPLLPVFGERMVF
jgi:hypothetical protein